MVTILDSFVFEILSFTKIKIVILRLLVMRSSEKRAVPVISVVKLFSPKPVKTITRSVVVEVHR